MLHFSARQFHILFFFVLVCLCFPAADSSGRTGYSRAECNPKLYKPTDMPLLGETFNYQYCEDPKDGFNVKSDSNECANRVGAQRWFPTKNCYKGALGTTDYFCECTGYECEQNVASCKCASNYDERISQCYHTRSVCPDCAKGEYRSNCGCTLDTNANSYTCSFGICKKCPAGHKCPGGVGGNPQLSYFVEKCANGYEYQSEIGKDTCIPCRCNKGEYRVGTEGCGAGDSTSLSTTNFKCAVCTNCEESDVDVNNVCFRDWNKYKHDNKCHVCDNNACNHPNYFIGHPDRKHCHQKVKINSGTLDTCDKWYLPYTASLQEMRAADFQQTSSDYRAGIMPWEKGKRRWIPLRPRPIVGNKENSGMKGQVPFYMQCANLPEDMGKFEYIGEGDDNYKILQQSEEYAGAGWMHDCNMDIILKCKDTPTVWSKKKDELQLQYRTNDCKPCGEGNTGLEYNKNLSQCVCPEKTANTKISTSSLNEGIYKLTISVIEKPSKCALCASCDLKTPDFLTILNNQYYCVNFMCNNNSLLPFQGKQYYDIQSKEYKTCEQDTYPNNNRSGCVKCFQERQNEIYTEKNLGITFYECKDCNWITHYENITQKKCIERTKTCQIQGEYLVEIQDKYKDNYCTKCKKECPAGSIRITSKSQTKKFGCTSESDYFFGCITLQDMWNNPPALDVTWNFNYEKQEIEQEYCDLNLIPQYSYWVMYSPARANNKKISCYFSCLHGVDNHIAEQIHQLEQDQIQEDFDIGLRSFHQVDRDSGNTVSGNQVSIKRKKYRRPSSSANTPESIYWFHDEDQEMVTTSTKFYGNTFYYNTKLFQVYSDLYPLLCKSPEQAYAFNEKDKHCDSNSLLDANPEINMPDKNTMNEYTRQKKNTDLLIKCAYDARMNLLQDNQDDIWVYSPNSQKLACKIRNPQNYYESYDSLDICKENCHQIKIQRYWDQIETIANPTKKSNAYALSQWLFWKPWSSEEYDPYVFSVNQQDRSCPFECDSKAFKLDIALPNSQKMQVCVDKKNDNTLSQYCKNERDGAGYVRSESAQDLMCQVCSSRPNARLLTNSSEKSTWYADKQTFFSSQRLQLNEIQCRYECNAGYHSTNIFDYLTTAPCVQCPVLKKDVPCPSTLLSRGHYKVFPLCNTPTYTPKKFNPDDVCQQCSPLSFDLQDKVVFQPGEYEGNDKCKARCTDGFLTFLDTDTRMESPLASGSWIESSKIYQCVDCEKYPGFQCPNRFCADGYINATGGTCQLCVYTSCLASDQYRSICALNRNAQCKSCNQDYLKNFDRITRLNSEWFSSMSQADLNSIRRLLDDHSYNITRKYVSYNENSGVPIMVVQSNDMAVLQSDPNAVQCALACANNYFWMDIRTGTSPFRNGRTKISYNHQYYVCFPCQSVWFYGTSSQTRYSRPDMPSQFFQWYSIWNQSKPNDVNLTQLINPFRPGSLAYSLSLEQNLKGSCYPCAKFTHVTRSDSTVLCSSRLPGFAETQSSNLGSLTLTNPLPNVPITPAQLLTALSQYNLNSVVRTGRRLLQTTDDEISESPTPLPSENIDVIIIRKIKVEKHPAFYNTNDYSTCCERVFSRIDDQQNCKRRKLHLFEQKILQIGREYGDDYCDNVVGLPKAQVNPSVIKSPSHATTRRRLLQYTNVHPPSISIENVSIQEVNISISNITTNSRSIQIIVQIDDGLRCPAGQYKESTSIGNCENCPYGSSTIYPFTGSTSRYDCRCLDGFKRVPNENSPDSKFNFSCVECGRNFYRSYSDPSFDNDDTYCKPCPENMTTPTATSSFCYCNPGFYYNFNQSRCLECPMGSYCDRGIQYFCPMYSLSPPKSSRRKQCICDSATHYGNLEMEDSQCFPLKPGFDCPIASIDCKCAQNWTLKVASDDPSQTRCETPCVRGQYAVLNLHNKAVLECVKCPKGKYSSEFQALSNASCVSCPPLMTTQSAGAVNISDCSCSDKNSSTTSKDDCSSCKQGYYYDASTDACVQCPSGLSSFQGSTGIQSCYLCPLGQRTVTRPQNTQSNPFACEPCPLGFFSMSLGTKCTVCPRGYTTLNVGSISSLACVPFGTSSSLL